MRPRIESVNLHQGVSGDECIDLPAQVGAHDRDSLIVGNLEEVRVLAFEEDEMLGARVEDQLHWQNTIDPHVEQDKIVGKPERDCDLLFSAQHLGGCQIGGLCVQAGSDDQQPGKKEETMQCIRAHKRVVGGPDGGHNVVRCKTNLLLSYYRMNRLVRWPTN